MACVTSKLANPLIFMAIHSLVSRDWLHGVETGPQPAQGTGFRPPSGLPLADLGPCVQPVRISVLSEHLCTFSQSPLLQAASNRVQALTSSSLVTAYLIRQHHVPSLPAHAARRTPLVLMKAQSGTMGSLQPQGLKCYHL